MSLKQEIRDYIRENPDELHSLNEYYINNKETVDKIVIHKGKVQSPYEYNFLIFGIILVLLIIKLIKKLNNLSNP